MALDVRLGACRIPMVARDAAGETLCPDMTPSDPQNDVSDRHKSGVPILPYRRLSYAGHTGIVGNSRRDAAVPNELTDA